MSGQDGALVTSVLSWTLEPARHSWATGQDDVQVHWVLRPFASAAHVGAGRHDAPQARLALPRPLDPAPHVGAAGLDGPHARCGPNLLPEPALSDGATEEDRPHSHPEAPLVAYSRPVQWVLHRSPDGQDDEGAMTVSVIARHVSLPSVRAIWTEHDYASWSSSSQV